MRLWFLVLPGCMGMCAQEPVPVEEPEPTAVETKAEKRAARRAKRGPRLIELGTPTQELGLDGGPDVLFITWDTVRVDHLSTYGYHRETSPWLTELASDAVRFNLWVVPMSTTLPSHTTMFTGLEPGEHGILANAIGGERFVASDKMLSLPGHLGEQGYFVAGFVGAAPLRRNSGIAKGFHIWAEPPSTGKGSETIDTVLSWLPRAPADRPLFLWVHLYDPHHPRTPEGEYATMFTTDDATRAHAVARGIVSGPTAPDNKFDNINAYDGEIRFTDDQTRRLVEGWKAERSWDRTVVVFAADHGEGLRQHGHAQHGVTWHEQLHSPLVIRVPGVEAREVDGIMAGVDLLPTLLGLTELPGEQALLEQASGRDVLSTPGRAAFSRTSARQTGLGAPDTYALTDAQYKAVLAPDGTVSLYDRAVDPHELKDIAAAQPERAAAMGDEMRARLAAQAKVHAALGAGGTKKADEATLKELKQLGYLE